jgi:hypothetical protein
VSSAGLAVEQAHAHGEDLVEAALAEVQLLELGDEELGLSCRDVLGVAALRRLDHLGGAVDSREAPPVEPLADIGRRDALAAADLEHAVARLDAELVDDFQQAVAHSVSFSSFSSLRRVLIFRSPSCAVHSASMSTTNWRAIS